MCVSISDKLIHRFYIIVVGSDSARELMPRVRIDGFNESQVEAKSEGEGECYINFAVVVSYAIFLIT